MRNRRKTLLRDHSVPEVTLKACPRHYSISAVLETLTVRGPKKPPINGGESRQQLGQYCNSRNTRIWLKDNFLSETEREISDSTNSLTERCSVNKCNICSSEFWRSSRTKHELKLWHLRLPCLHKNQQLFKLTEIKATDCQNTKKHIQTIFQLLE